MGGHRLAQPVVGLALDPITGGYWEVASDGESSTSAVRRLSSPDPSSLGGSIVAIASAPSGQGYWEVANDGAVYS